MFIKKRNYFTASLLLCAVMFCSNTWATVRYIDDTLRAPLRSGAGTEYRIVSFLNSGAKVEQQELAEENEDWAFVKLDNGTEGWVQRMYLRNTPVARDLLVASQRELTALRQKNEEQTQQIRQLGNELRDLNNQLAKLQKHSDATDKELLHIKDISQNSIRLDSTNNQLLEENELLKASHEESQQLLIKLENNQKNQGIIYGVLAILLGIFLGVALPKIKSNRSSDWT